MTEHSSSDELLDSLTTRMDVDSGAEAASDASRPAPAPASASKRRVGRPSTSSKQLPTPKSGERVSNMSGHPDPELLPSSFPFKSTAPIPREGFLAIPTLDASMPPEKLRIAMMEYEESGIPVVVRGLHKLPGWKDALFTPDWLLANTAGPEETISVRNIHKRQDRQMPLREFIQRCKDIGDIVPGEEERYYGKDGICPPQWEAWLSSAKVVPKHILPFGTEDAFRFLDPRDRAETLMTYFGVGGTFTPCHKDLCASVGQNLMVHTENEGSSVWYMTARDDAATVSQYFQSLNQEIDLETHVASEGELKTAPFKVYMHRQEKGDLILVPQRSCHQVINEGGITIKLSWSRMILSSLVQAYRGELPIYHRVCRPEIYGVKSLIHGAVKALTRQLSEALVGSHGEITPRVRSLSDALKPLVECFTEIIVAAWDIKRKGEPETFDPDQLYRLCCDFCGADIFQSYFECRECDEEKHEPVTICSDCYVEGRTCVCEYMEPVLVRPFKALLEVRNKAVSVLNRSLLDRKQHMNAEYSHENLEEDGAPQVHRAACILSEKLRTQKDELAKCREGGVHEVPTPHSVNCSGCHRRVCFAHMLRVTKAHSGALILWSSNGKNFHQAHSSFKQAYLTAVHEMEQHKAGLEHLTGWIRLSRAVIQYQKCRPLINARLMMGFFDQDYDHPTEEPLTKSQRRLNQAGKKRAAPEADKGQDSMILSPLEHRSTSSHVGKKRKISTPAKRVEPAAAGVSIKKEPVTASIPDSATLAATLATPPQAPHGQNSAAIPSAPIATVPSSAEPLAFPDPPIVPAPHPSLPEDILATMPIPVPPPPIPGVGPPPILTGVDNHILVNVVKEVSDELAEIRKESETTHRANRSETASLLASYKAEMDARFNVQEQAYAVQLEAQARLLTESEKQNELLKAQVTRLEAQLRDAEARLRRNDAIIDRLIGTAVDSASVPPATPDRNSSVPSPKMPTSGGRFTRKPGVL